MCPYLRSFRCFGEKQKAPASGKHFIPYNSYVGSCKKQANGRTSPFQKTGQRQRLPMSHQQVPLGDTFVAEAIVYTGVFLISLPDLPDPLQNAAVILVAKLIRDVLQGPALHPHLQYLLVLDG